MSWGWIGAAAVGVVGSVVSGSMASDAAGDAAGAQINAANASSAETRRAEEAALARLRPYSTAGSAADDYIYALLGLPRRVQSANVAANTVPDWAAYWAKVEPTTRNNPTSPWHQVAQEAAGDPAKLGQLYYQWSGGYGGAPPTMQAPADPNAPASSNDNAPDTATYNAAMAAYEASPWARFATQGAETARRNANESFLSTAGARGSLVSGRTAAGLYDIAQEAEDERFRIGFTNGYYPSLTAVSQRGFDAAQGSNSAAMTSAAQIGANSIRAGEAAADGIVGANNATVSGINQALYYAGNAYDGLTNRTPRTTTPAAITNGARTGTSGSIKTALGAYKGG
jgi:hypothetical protein